MHTRSIHFPYFEAALKSRWNQGWRRKINKNRRSQMRRCLSASKGKGRCKCMFVRALHMRETWDWESKEGRNCNSGIKVKSFLSPLSLMTNDDGKSLLKFNWFCLTHDRKFCIFKGQLELCARTPKSAYRPPNWTNRCNTLGRKCRAYFDNKSMI